MLTVDQIYNNDKELSANANSSANIPSCFFCTELSAFIKS